MRSINYIYHIKIFASLLAVLFSGIFDTLSAQETSIRMDGIWLGGDTIIDYTVGDYAISYVGDSAFTITASPANTCNMAKGEPMLPQQVFMLTVSSGAKVSIRILSEEWDTIALGGRRPFAAQGARPKNMEQSERQQTIDDETYAHQQPVAELTRLGIMRDRQVVRLILSPFVYYPSQDKLLVCRSIKVKVDVDSDKEYSNTMPSDDLAVHYTIVAPEHFRQTLQSFISWKRQEGYIVEETYVTSPDRNAIKEHLQQRYDNATADMPAPLYLLIVGDVDDIPVWMGQQRIEGIDRHITDLPYAEYTGDSLPDIMVGRWPVSDTATLHAIIDKTLAYERYQMTDSNHLHRSLLVAGAEDIEPAPTVTNGQVYYLKQRIAEADDGNDTLCYYNPSSATHRDEILNVMSQGVGIVSYTSHCLAGGWRNPTIVNSDIDALPENGNLFIAINNCCRANAFAGDCFGEHLLRKANGGAVAAIGATNETLWDEDYYWNVGNQTIITDTPSYNSAGLGAYDRLLHTHGESLTQQAASMGQMLWAGNWAVSRSGSQFDAFYWEIYCLLGDPSLMPFAGIPAGQTLSHDTIHCNDTVASFSGTPNARIAITRNDTLLGICSLDEEGTGTMHCRQPLKGNITITATAQFHRPWQATLLPEGCSTEAIETASHNLSEIRLYPTPASYMITMTGFSEPTRITIHDMTGHTVDIFKAQSGETIQYYTHNLRCGIYNIVFESATNRTVRKIVISE